MARQLALAPIPIKSNSMTWRKRTIMEMAREAGISSAVGKHIALDSDLERFAELVREEAQAEEREAIKQANAPEIERINAYIKRLEDAAMLIEREECAKLCEQGLAIATSLSALDDMEIWGEKFAAAIRARGDKHD